MENEAAVLNTMQKMLTDISTSTTETIIPSLKCSRCNDTGWYIFEDDNGYLMQAECTCGILKKIRMQNRLKFANLPESFKDMRLNTFSLGAYKEPQSKVVAKTACNSIRFYLEHWEEMKKTGKGLYLYSGTKGSGKTRMAASIANELMDAKNTPVKFASSMQIISEIKSTWGSTTGYSESKLLDDLITTNVLIIDDFGTEQARDWINEKYYSIINGRYVENKVTIFTSNMNLSDLQYDERITNRIKEKCYLIPFPEESVREHKAKEMSEELAAGRKENVNG